MPKQIPENAKRVPLNCLIRPDTKQEIQERAINGKSQGEVIDEAISALYRETGTAYDVKNATAIMVEKIPGKNPEAKSRSVLRRLEAQRPFKGPLLKPKERKESK